MAGLPDLLTNRRAFLLIFMRTLKRKTKKESYRPPLESLKSFYQLIADIKSPQEAEKIFSGLFSKSEIITVAKKLAVAKALQEKVSYLKIRQAFNVSSATISQIQSLLKKQPGIFLALNKINADAWAEKWAKKIKSLFGQD